MLQALAQSIGSTASHQWEGASIPEAAKDTQPAEHWYLLDQQRGIAEVGEGLAGIHSFSEYVFSVHCVQSTVLGPEDPAVDCQNRQSLHHQQQHQQRVCILLGKTDNKHKKQLNLPVVPNAKKKANPIRGRKLSEMREQMGVSPR